MARSSLDSLREGLGATVRIRHVLAMLLVTTALLMTSGPADAGSDRTADEGAFVAMINQLRTSAGLNPLIVDPELRAQSRRWAEVMAGDDQLKHAPDLSVGITADWAVLGENVGMHSVADLEQLFAAFVNSPAHHDNLLEPRFTYVGVGVVYGPDGTIWTTHRFMGLRQPAPAPAPAPAPTTAPPTTEPPTTGPPPTAPPPTTKPPTTRPPTTRPLVTAAAPPTTRPPATRPLVTAAAPPTTRRRTTRPLVTAGAPPVAARPFVPVATAAPTTTGLDDSDPSGAERYSITGSISPSVAEPTSIATASPERLQPRPAPLDRRLITSILTELDQVGR